MVRIISVLLVVMFANSVSSQIHCPDDKEITCLSSLSPEECGYATVFSSNYHPSQIKYEDDAQISACNDGVVFRNWYIDVDFDNEYTDGEPQCIQTITLDYESLPLNIQFPADMTLSCVDDVPVSSPTWSHHPCDLIGYTSEDEIFFFEEGACQKIVRTFSVINWCVYEASGNGTDGLFEGIQIIKIVDNEKPVIQDCEDKFFDALTNCEAEIMLTNTAADLGDCPSGELKWTLSVDLWADGTTDYLFGPDQPSPFNIAPVVNGAEVSVSFPEALAISNNKAVWTVTDGCGNFSSCPIEFTVADNKAPTPYCIEFLHATLNGTNGGKLDIPVELFGLDTQDNCTASENIRLSFSDNPDDKIRTIECGEIGFQFFRVYHTDEAGNQDFCEVFMFVLDNGSCAGNFTVDGTVSTRSGLAITDANSSLMSVGTMIATGELDSQGHFSLGEQGLMETYYVTIEKEEDPMVGVNLEDYAIMIDAALGLSPMDEYQTRAADVNSDGLFNLDDVKLLRNVIRGEDHLNGQDAWTFVPAFGTEDGRFSITDYRGSFDFIGVKRGDITGATADSEKVVETITLEAIITNDGISVVSTEENEVGYYSVGAASIEDGMRINNLTERSRLLRTGEVIGHIQSDVAKMSTSEVIAHLRDNTQVLHQSVNQLMNVEWIVTDDRSEDNKVSSSEVTRVFPTLFVNQINVFGHDISKIMLLDVTGQNIDIKQSLTTDGQFIIKTNDLPNGIYFVVVEFSKGKREIFKVVHQ